MRIEIICTGDEVLTGKIVNTNFSYMSQKLEDFGLSVTWGTTVGDDREELLAAFRLSAERADAVIVNGGLGPTVDDLSQEIAAKAAGVDLALNEGNSGAAAHVREAQPREHRRHGARAPMRGVAGLLAGGQGHDALPQACTDRGFASGPGGVFQQPRHTQRDKTLAPARNFFRRHGQEDGNLLVLSACGSKQHDASAFHHSQRKRPAPGLGFQHPPLLRTQPNDWGSAHPQASPYILRRGRIDKGC